MAGLVRQGGRWGQALLQQRGVQAMRLQGPAVGWRRDSLAASSLGIRHYAYSGPRKPNARQIQTRKKHAQDMRERKAAPKEVLMPIVCTPKSLSHTLGVRTIDILKEMIKMGLEPRSSEEILDTNLADLLAEEFHFIPKHERETVDILPDSSRLNKGEFPSRPPVVVVAGHVDHGKTSLLDALRNTTVAEKEAGGITQHISAFEVDVHGKRTTFIDTPGHAAFTKMRSRGLRVADVTVLVIAADAGIQDQTEEVLKNVLESDTPVVVAINKVDKANADPDLVMKQLASHGVQVEQLGGDVQCVEISATENIGLEELLDAIQLQADLLDLRADQECRAEGVVVEVSKEKGRGVVASVILRCGTLRHNDAFVSGDSFGRIRAIYSSQGKKLPDAGPSRPVGVNGMKRGMPQPGDDLLVVEDLDQAKEIVDYRVRKSKLEERASMEVQRAEEERELAAALKAGTKNAKKEEEEEDTVSQNKIVVRVVLKADVPGSVEAIKSVVDELPLEEHGVEVDLHSTGVGILTETDVRMAKALKALLLGFNVSLPAPVAMVSKSEGWPVYQCRIIYDAAARIASAVEEVLPPHIETHAEGSAEVRDVFSITVRGNKTMQVAGCLVESGTMARKNKARILRDGVPLHAGRLESLKSFKKDVREVRQSNECGIRIVGWNDYRPGDVIECFTTTSTPQTLQLPSHLEPPSG